MLVGTNLSNIFLICRSEADIITLKKRYPALYIPSDFFTSRIRWCETFPVTKPFTLNRPCSFHIMHKDCDSYKKNDAIIDPPDLDYTFSAKVSGGKNFFHKNHFTGLLFSIRIFRCRLC